MERGKRRGDVPEEELRWLREHTHCESINKLFDEYSERFDSPYTTIVSFRLLLAKYRIYPITKRIGYENVNAMFEMMEKGPVRWTFRGHTVHRITRDPHWLWRWHPYSYRQPSGVIFKPHPLRLKEKQFEQDMGSRDTDQGSKPQRINRGLQDELPQSEQHEAQVSGRDRDVYFSSAEDEETCGHRLPVDGEEQSP